MGISKAMMEKVAVAKSRNSGSTIICSIRFGNVLASRGSVVPLFVKQILDSKPITITDPKMTRFMMTLSDAVTLVLYAFENGNSGDIFVQKAPATTLDILTKALTNLMDSPDHKIQIIGTRHGEKLHEVLLSREEIVAAEDKGDYYRIPPDLRDLSYNKFLNEGEPKISDAQEFNSYNSKQLDEKSVSDLLMNLNFIKLTKEGKYIDPEM
jgi:UDP-glucose 4-epimerase